MSSINLKATLAWAIAQSLAKEGATLVFTYQGERIKENVESLANSLSGSLTLPCDVSKDDEIDAVIDRIRVEHGKLDAIAHCIAFAQKEDLDGQFVNTSRHGFHIALDISAYSLTALTRSALPLMEKDGGSIITLSYLARIFHEDSVG